MLHLFDQKQIKIVSVINILLTKIYLTKKSSNKKFIKNYKFLNTVRSHIIKNLD
jgi:hypothetical protein